MPAVNIIEIQDQVSKSGLESSGPRRRLPKRLKAMNRTNTTNRVVARI